MADKKLRTWGLLLGGLVVMGKGMHCWCTHLTLRARVRSSSVSYFPLKVVISGSLAHSAFFRRHLLLQFRKVLCICFPLMAFGASPVG